MNPILKIHLKRILACAWLTLVLVGIIYLASISEAVRILMVAGLIVVVGVLVCWLTQWSIEQWVGQ